MAVGWCNSDGSSTQEINPSGKRLGLGRCPAVDGKRLHIAAVVVTEVPEKNGLISAMFTGEKVLFALWVPKIHATLGR
jgi:hypothetical protein